MHTQQADDREIAQHLVQRAGTVLASEGGGILTTLDGSELLVDLRALDEGVEHVQHGVAAPGVGVLAEKLSLLLGRAAPGDSVAIAAEGLELVDELIDNIPGPVVLE